MQCPCPTTVPSFTRRKAIPGCAHTVMIPEVHQVALSFSPIITTTTHASCSSATNATCVPTAPRSVLVPSEQRGTAQGWLCPGINS